MKCRIQLLVAAASFALTGHALAHHSHAMYDASGTIELQGTVTEVRWRNPHVWMYLEVEENGATRTWAFEGAAIAQLERKGWTQDSMKPGDAVHIACYPLRNGGPGCLGGYVLSINGEELPATHENHAGREWD
jgi:hypothetical protein